MDDSRRWLVAFDDDERLAPRDMEAVGALREHVFSHPAAFLGSPAARGCSALLRERRCGVTGGMVAPSAQAHYASVLLERKECQVARARKCFGAFRAVHPADYRKAHRPRGGWAGKRADGAEALRPVFRLRGEVGLFVPTPRSNYAIKIRRKSGRNREDSGVSLPSLRLASAQAT